MKCPKHKKQEMTLKLGKPGDDVGWICNTCKSGIWPLTKQEYDIWKNGYAYAIDETSRAVEDSKRLKQIKIALGVIESYEPDNSY